MRLDLNKLVAYSAVALILSVGVATAADPPKDKKAESKPAEKSAKATDAKPAAKAPEHSAYAETLWKFITKSPYTKWKTVDKIPDRAAGPAIPAGAKIYANKPALTKLDDPPHGAAFVIEYYAPDAKTKKPALSGICVKFRPAKGYDAAQGDWYWAYFLPGGKHVECSIVTKPYAKPGFITFEKKGILWTFRAGNSELVDYVKYGDVAYNVTLPGVGPNGMSVRGPDRDTIVDYVIARPGFVTKVVKDQLWVFRTGTKEAGEFAKQGPPPMCVTRPLAGPLGMTLRGPDAATLSEYSTARPGFETIVRDGRLWVFRPGSKELDQFRKNGELAIHTVRPGAGPDGMTIKAPDAATIVEYLTSREGFTTVSDKDRLWIFRRGAEELSKFRKDGELPQHVVRPAAGPAGVTVRAPDGETLDLYLSIAQQ
jgi:hypothetical protein